MEDTEPYSAAGDYPRWVLLDRTTGCQGPSTADAGTLAGCVNSAGRPVQASFCLVAPPTVSTLHVHVDEVEGNYRTAVLAAHGDSVLIHMTPHDQPYHPPELLVYNAGDGAARPPSLSLLPPCDDTICHAKTGILRLGGGDGEFVVACLEITCRDNLAGSFEVIKTGLRMLRSGRCEWELTGHLPVRRTDGQEMKLSSYWANTVIPVGDRFLYWIDQSRGIIFSDFMAESPELWYVPLPIDNVLPDHDRCNRPRCKQCRDASRSVCVTGGGSVVKFVWVSPRCCSTCPRYPHAFTITTWTLRTDDMTWVEDGMVDCNELSVLPRVPLDFPIISLDNPDVICFMSRESWHHPCSHGDKTTWFLTVDTRRKTLQRVRGYLTDEGRPYRWNRALIPSEVSNHFNACRGSGGSAASHEDTGVSTAEARDDKSEISAVVEEIPDMGRDEMLKAHKVLAGDDRRMRFLAALPVDMRKEYCMLMTEVAASSAVRQLSP